MRPHRIALAVAALAIVACTTRGDLDWGGPENAIGVRSVIGGAEVWWQGTGAVEVTTNLALAPVPLSGTPPIVVPATGTLHARIDGGEWVGAGPVPVGHDGLGAHPVAMWLDSSLSGSRFGFPIVAVGDLDGDGFEDVAFGANEHSSPQIEEGIAVVRRGGSGGFGAELWRVESDLDYAHFGKALAIVGDVNGDGRDDLAVGGSDWSVGFSGQGVARVFPGLPGGFATEPIATIEGTQANSWLGRHFGRGDVSCDGIDDWIVSEHGWDGPLGLNQGRLLVFEGPIQSAILTTGATWIFEGEAPFTLSPYGLNPHAGDVDGDGCDDLLVGEHLHDGAAVNTGRAVLYLGSPGGPVPSGWIYSGTAGGEQAGFAVDFVGDVNGDGYDDLAVGVPRRAADAGAVLVFHGGPLGPSAQPAVTIDGAAAEQLGRGVAAGGDVNGDGWNDLLVGAPYADGARGRVALHLGGPSGVSVEPAWEAFGTRPDGYLGGALATADVDGDGTPDVLVGPVGLEGLEVNASAYLFSGPPRAGAALRVYPEIAAAGVPLSLDISMDGARGPCTCTIEWGGETDVVDGCDPSTLGAVQRVFAPGAHPVRVTLVDAFGLRSEALATIEAR